MGFINKEKGLIIYLNGNISSLSKNRFINKGFINGFVLLTNKNSKELAGFINEVYNKRDDFGNRLE